MSTRTFPGLATVTLQGGGLYGLALLGQLDALLARKQVTPLAYLGNSAGGIVATLAWSGVTPSQARDELARLADTPSKPAGCGQPLNVDGTPRSRLVDLLSPFEAHQGGPGVDLCALSRHIRSISTQLGVMASKDPEVGNVAKGVAYVKLNWHLLRAKSLAKRVAAALGIFPGNGIEALLERLMQGTARFRAVGKRVKDPVVRMADARGLPGLMLTTFDLADGAARLLSSFDGAIDDVSLAAAAHASGCFPFFFQPVKQTIDSTVHRFVDGGVVTNFPLWATGNVRGELDTVDRTASIARLPIIHFGLRRGADVGRAVIDDDAASFLGLIGSTLAGGARDLYEDYLERLFPNAWVLRQPVADLLWPYGFLEIDKVTGNGVRHLFDRGRRWADEQLKPLNLLFPDEQRPAISEMLDDLCQRVGDISRADGLAAPRAALFLPDADLNLCSAYSRVAGADNVDADRAIEVDLRSGLVGAVFMSGTPMLADPRQIGLAYTIGDAAARERPIDGNPGQFANVPPTRGLAIAAPLFSGVSDEPQPLLMSGGTAAARLAQLRARYGILCLDFNLADDRTYDLRVLRSTSRVGAIVDIMEATCRRLASIVVPAAMGKRGSIT